MNRTCRQCGQQFEITPSDLAFYEKVSPTFNGKKELIPPPAFCPACRMQRRLLFRNDLSLYHRTSDLTGKQIISMYAPDKPYKVYDQDEWWSDRWDELSYGRDFNFSRTFTEQFKELDLAVPHQSLFTTNAENSYYTNHSINTRNSYLIAGATNLEDCLFGRFIISGHDVVDGLSLYGCEWCYEGVASQRCYNCLFFRHCRDCSFCVMVDDCQSCKNCCMCYGLRNKEYCYLNEQCTKEEYERKIRSHFPLTVSGINAMRQELVQLVATLPHRSLHVFGSEDCTGDMVFNSKNCHHCFDITDCEECEYVSNTPKGKWSRDANYTAPDGIEWCYNVGSTVGVQRAMGTFLAWYGSDAYYSRECHRSSNVFGCVGMRHKQYCVLNKQYTKEEYEALVPRIIAHMRKEGSGSAMNPSPEGTSGSWGDYLRPELSTMGYNETLAQDYFPLTKEKVLQKGWQWHEETDPQNQYLGPDYVIPEHINDVPDDITKQILRCSVTGKPYKIIPQELKFYRQMGIPIPRKCPDQRHKERMALRNP
ncbi:MAG: hypothetical protein AAB728_05075, partial [Patescibacteria group bacterium]